MIAALWDFTALPNLHPAVVHFPIALLPLALAFDGAGLLLIRQRWLAPAATALYGAAAVGAWLAVWAGRTAADGLVDLPPAVQPHIADHSDWAHSTSYALLLVAALRLGVHLTSKLTAHRGARSAVLALGLAVLALLVWTADLGGALVYHHGLGVKRPATEADVHGEPHRPGTVTEEPHGSASGRLTRGEDGTVLWRPNPGDREALGEVLTATADTRLEAIHWVEAREGSGLTLEVDGTVVLLLPDTFGDVQVEFTLETLDFEGTVGVVHHAAADGSSRGVFQVSTTGEATLARFSDGTLKSLDRQPTRWTRGERKIAVSAAGRHLKGMIDGRTVAHGHIDTAPDGGCGLLIDGRGQLRIVEAHIIPIHGH